MQPPYRAEPTSSPLVSWCSGTLLALDPTTGALRWERELDRNLARMLVTDRLIAFATSGAEAELHFFDLATGADRGRVAIGFEVRAAIRRGDLLLFSGPAGIIALRVDGSIAWRAGAELVSTSAWSGSTHDLVGRDSSGAERWRLAKRKTLMSSALAIDGEIAQPDLDT